VRRILLVSAAAVLFLSGCGSSDSGTTSGDLDDVTVSSGASPDVSVAKGFSVATTKTKVLTEGTGADVAAGDSVKVNYVAVNGRTGKQFDSSFKTGTPYTVSLADGKILPGFIKGLEGQKLGSRVLVAMSPKDGFGQAQAQLDVKKDDTLLFLFDVVSKVPTEATGTARKLPSDVPEIVFDDKKQPDGFAKNSKAPKNPTEASSYTVIEGDGAPVSAEQTVTINYVGQVYPQGEVFDSSWRNGEPFTRSLSELIPCWQTQLAGTKIGSRVILVCPKSTAYAGSESELKDDDLIFAVDVLDAY
jgi:FKBP-type peptidyl-prolyl cis-trans isomerase